MGRFSILIYSSIFFLFNSCCGIPLISPRKFYTTEYGSNRPKKNNFKLNIDLKDNYNLSGVYLSKNKDVYYRFFKNSRVLISGINPNLKIEKQYNNIQKGRVGLYKIEGNSLLLEYFSVGSHDCGKYHIYDHKIVTDSIIGFKKVKIKNLKGVPNW